VGEDTFSATVTLSGTGIPITGTVFYPAVSNGTRTPFATTLTTPAPVVILAHGNHAIFRHPTDRFREGCEREPGFVPVENHRGYEYLQRLLAGMGMVVVSVDANTTNCDDGLGLSSTNIHLRGKLILASIKHFQNLHATGTSRFRGKLDLAKTALFGHSRGGEAVLVAAETLPTVAELSSVRILGVFSLAPTDTGATSGRPNSFAYLTILPAADGDVSDNDGAKFYDQAVPGPFKCQIYIHGANHNFFNRNWPADEGHGVSRLSRAEHERILSVYACAFFRNLLLGHDTLRFLRRDVLPPGTPTDRVHISFESVGATTVDDHENRNISLNALGAPTTQSSGLTGAEFDFQQGVLSSFNGSFFGKTVGMVLQSSAASGLFRSQLPASVNLTEREIWVRVAEVYDGVSVPAASTGYQIGLEDAAGRTSFADSDGAGGVPRPFDRRADDVATLGFDRTKTMLKTHRFAAACFAQSGFDLTQVRAVLLRLNRGDGRALAFDQLQIV
jgi:pimeloyl-ACP methyl ester carboxylesterase